MNTTLFQASYKGEVETLKLLLQENSTILAGISADSNAPLHIACLLGHLNFADEILKLSPYNLSLCQQLNQDGCSPLHLATTNCHIEIVRLLLRFGLEHSIIRELCLKKDKEERTPLHCAVIRGRLDIIGELLAACPESVLEKTVQGETVLHLAVKNNFCQTFMFLVQGKFYTKDLLNLADTEGNTLLHLAAFRKQIQVIRTLISQPNLEVNTANSHGLTALDLLLLSPTHCYDLEIGEIIRSAGGVRSQIQLPSPTEDQLLPPSNHKTSGNNKKTSLNLSNQYVKDSEHNGYEDYDLLAMRDGLMTMASLVVTITFQIAVCPPGGNWVDASPKPENLNNDTRTRVEGNSVLYDRNRKAYNAFIILDTQAFLASLCLILILMRPRECIANPWKCLLIRRLAQFIVAVIIVIFIIAVSSTTEWKLYTRFVDYIFVAPWVLYVFILVVVLPIVKRWQPSQKTNEAIEQEEENQSDERWEWSWNKAKVRSTKGKGIN